ncbi:hypothetical protein GCM10026983_08070 [Gracilibacillus alcaliphilus]
MTNGPIGSTYVQWGREEMTKFAMSELAHTMCRNLDERSVITASDKKKAHNLLYALILIAFSSHQ